VKPEHATGETQAEQNETQAEQNKANDPPA
jgi:hypothetical protein